MQNVKYKTDVDTYENAHLVVRLMINISDVVHICAICAFNELLLPLPSCYFRGLRKEKFPCPVYFVIAVSG